MFDKMESLSSRNFHFEENDRCSTGSSTLISDQEMTDYQETQKSVTSQEEQQEDVQNHSKDTETEMASVDLQTMVQNYKQISGDLLNNLKVLERKTQALNKTLREISHECEILYQQKEFQMKTLVDLQIKLENLDMERVKILEETQKDKTEKTELFTRELQCLLENDDYLKITYDKFHSVLQTEKNNFENFEVLFKRETELHNKAGETYLNEMRELNNEFHRIHNDLLGKEQKVIEELDQTMVKCKTLIETKAKLLQENECYEKKLKVKNENLSSLKTELEQRNMALSEALNKLNDMEVSFIDKQRDLQNNIVVLKNECDSISKENEILNKDLTEKNATLESLRHDIDELNKTLSNIQSENIGIQEELNSVIEVQKLLCIQLDVETSEKASLKTQAVELPALEEKLNELNTFECDMQGALAKLLEEEASMSETLDVAKNNEQAVKEKLATVQGELEAWKTKSKEAEKEEAELSESFKQFSFDAEKLVSERNNEYNELVSVTENNKTLENKLSEDISFIEESISVLEKKEKELTEESTLHENECIELEQLDVDVEKSKEEVQLLENELISIDNELEDLAKSLAETQEIEELENEVKNLELKIEETTSTYKNEIEIIESSFTNHVKILEEKNEKELKEVARLIAREESRTKRMLEAVPHLNQDIKVLEADLKKSLPSIVKEIRSAVRTLDEVADYYSHMFNESKKKGTNPSTLRNLSAIEEHLAKPIKCLLTLDGMPNVNVEEPAPNTYKNVIRSFLETHGSIFDQIDSNPPLEMALKLQEIGSCVFGKKWVKPTYSNVLNETEISSSTTEVYF